MSIMANLFEFVSGLGWYFMGSTVFMAVFLIVTYMWTPALVFLRAKSRGGILAEVPRRDNRTEFALGKNEDGVLRTKYGFHLISEGSVRQEAKSGVPLTLAPDGIGATLPKDVISIIHTLKSPPYGFHDIDTIERAVREWGSCGKCGYEGVLDMDTEEEKNDKGEPIGVKFKNWKCPNPKCGSTESVRNSDFKIDSPLFETKSVNDLKRFFRYSMSPRGIEELVSRKVVEETADQARGMMKWVAVAFAAAILFIGAGIGVVLVFNGIG